MPRLLLSHNPGYWPSVGGSERMLQHILEGVRDDFEHIVVFTNVQEAYEHNGIQVRPYSIAGIRRFAVRERPDVYFPMMMHNRITYRNIAWLSRWSGRTILYAVGGLVGGWLPGSVSARYRLRVARRAERYADVVVHQDALSTEWLTDKALVPGVPVVFIPQGLHWAELNAVRSETPEGYFVFAQNLFRWKRPDAFLLDVVAQAPELEFKIIASDRTGDAIEETMGAAASLPNVEVELGLPRHEFLQALAKAAAVVSTSSAEGAQPNIMLEAGALGVPFLSLAPGQNFAHYEHVEMFSSTTEMVRRIRSAGPDIRKEKAEVLKQARVRLRGEAYEWDVHLAQFRALFLDPLPAPPASPPTAAYVKGRELYNRVRWR
jgi:glycosyltransferase involved in cell wall biosynthesis